MVLSFFLDKYSAQNGFSIGDSSNAYQKEKQKLRLFFDDTTVYIDDEGYWEETQNTRVIPSKSIGKGKIDELK